MNEKIQGLITIFAKHNICEDLLHDRPFIFIYLDGMDYLTCFTNGKCNPSQCKADDDYGT